MHGASVHPRISNPEFSYLLWTIYTVFHSISPLAMQSVNQTVSDQSVIEVDLQSFKLLFLFVT